MFFAESTTDKNLFHCSIGENESHKFLSRSNPDLYTTKINTIV